MITDMTKDNMRCEICGKSASKVNDEYPGCVVYPLCDYHYNIRHGIANMKVDVFEFGVVCAQCGEKPSKFDPINGHPYCQKHYEDRIDDNPKYYE